MPNNVKNSQRSRKRRNRKHRFQLLSQEDYKAQVVSLLIKADEIIAEDMEKAQQFARQARKIQMKTRIKFPPEWKKRFCKHCKAFLYPGVNSRVRLSSTNKVIAIKCDHCNKHTRIPYYRSKEVKNEL
jgi:ribonuclease P protein subunit RPR2